MKSIYPFSLVLLVLASGCSAPQKPLAAAIQRQHGSWRTLQYFTAFDATGVAGGMAEMTAAGEASVGKKQDGGPVCLSAEVARKDDLTARLNEAIHFGPEWKITRSQVTAGQVDFLATMDDPQAGKGEMTITGQITPSSTDLLVTTDGYQPTPGKGHIHTVMKQENTRVSDCTPGEDSWN